MTRLENVLKASLQDVMKMSWRHFCKTSWRGLEDIWPRRIYWPWPRRFEVVLKTCSEDVWVRPLCSSWSRRIEDVFRLRLQKTSSSRRTFTGYLLEKNFRLQLKVYDGCHVVLMMSINLNDIAILNIFDVDHYCIITGISKTEALNLLQNTDISKKVNIIKHENLLWNIKDG